MNRGSMKQKEKNKQSSKTTENKKQNKTEPSVQHSLLGMGMVFRHQVKF